MRIASYRNLSSDKLLKYSCIAFCVWTAGDAVKSLSGRVTLTDMRFNFLGSVAIERTLCAGAAAGGIFYGYKQRKLRQKKTEHLEGRIHQLENTIDPGRTSSHLTPLGTTNPRDDENE
jgi:hypothetical protein